SRVRERIGLRSEFSLPRVRERIGLRSGFSLSRVRERVGLRSEFSLPRARERVGVRAARAALVLVACAHTANAALFDDDEARKRIANTNTRLDQIQTDLETRLTALEQQLKNQGLDLLREVEGIKSDVARIRG